MDPFNPMKPSILIVDDEQHIRSILCEILASLDYNVFAVGNGKEAIKEIEKNSYNLVITDMMMPEMGGLELLEAIKPIAPDIMVIMMTGFGTIASAVEAMKKGAYEYVLKPFKLDELISTIKRALDKQLADKKDIKIKDAFALLNLNEAIGAGIEREKVIAIIIEATLREIEADVVTCLLRDESTERFKVKLKHSLEDKDFGELLGEFDSEDADRFFNQDIVFLLDKNEIKKSFPAIPNVNDIVSFISIPLKINNKIIGIINAYSFTPGHNFTEGQCKSAAIIAGRAASIIDNEQLYDSVQKTFKETVKSFAFALEAKDQYTHGHSEKVTLYSELICRAMQLPEDETEKICLAAQLHDIGKIGITEEVLNKPGRLTFEEYEIIKSHPVTGERILRPLHFLKDVIPIILYHHEKHDGTGYPAGLKGDAIPLGARIIAVGDTYDAMTSDRPYRKGLSFEVTINELIRCKDTQFAPEIVDVFIKLMEERYDKGEET